MVAPVSCRRRQSCAHHRTVFQSSWSPNPLARRIVPVPDCPPVVEEVFGSSWLPNQLARRTAPVRRRLPVIEQSSSRRSHRVIQGARASARQSSESSELDHFISVINGARIGAPVIESIGAPVGQRPSYTDSFPTAAPVNNPI